MNKEYPIVEPITLVTTNILTKYTINNLSITPFVQATMIINMYNERNEFIKSVYLTMDGEDYQNWQGDDAYLTNWINIQIH